MQLFINPGHAPHGRPDPGAVAADGTQEAVLVREIAEATAERCRAAGISVAVEQYDDLDYVVALANEQGADLFLSYHANAAKNSTAFGAEVYVHPEAGEAARAFAERIVAQARAAHWPVRCSTTHGYKEANFQVLRETRMPAVLLEVGFLSHPQELRRLQEYGADLWADILVKAVI